MDFFLPTPAPNVMTLDVSHKALHEQCFIKVYSFQNNPVVKVS